MKRKIILNNGNAMIEVKHSFLTRAIESSIIIKTERSKVWNELINFSQWNSWNSFITQVNGRLKKGEKLEITVSTPGMKSSIFKPTVYEVEECKKISWGGKAIWAGFSGVHDFYITQIDEGTVKFTQVEIFKGPVVLFMTKMLLKIAEGYQNMNNELKTLLEK